MHISNSTHFDAVAWSDLQVSDHYTAIHLSYIQIEEISPSIHVWTGQYVEWISTNGQPTKRDTTAGKAIDNRRAAIERNAALYPRVGHTDTQVPYVLPALVSRFQRQNVKKPSVRRTPCRNELGTTGLSGIVPEMTHKRRH